MSCSVAARRAVHVLPRLRAIMFPRPTSALPDTASPATAIRRRVAGHPSAASPTEATAVAVAKLEGVTTATTITGARRTPVVPVSARQWSGTGFTADTRITPTSPIVVGSRRIRTWSPVRPGFTMELLPARWSPSPAAIDWLRPICRNRSIARGGRRLHLAGIGRVHRSVKGVGWESSPLQTFFSARSLAIAQGCL